MSANAIVEKETSSEQTERETQKATPRRKKGKPADFSNVSPDAVAKYEPLIRSLCQSGKHGAALTYDEKFSAGTLGALRALATFDPTRGTSEAFWVSYQADAAIKREARKARRRVVCVDSTAFDFAAERSESPDETASRNEERELFRAGSKRSTNEVGGSFKRSGSKGGASAKSRRRKGFRNLGRRGFTVARSTKFDVMSSKAAATATKRNGAANEKENKL